MVFRAPLFLFSLLTFSVIHSQKPDPHKPDFTSPRQIPGMQLGLNDKTNGGNLINSRFPITYKVDDVRYYKKL